MKGALSAMERKGHSPWGGCCPGPISPTPWRRAFRGAHCWQPPWKARLSQQAGAPGLRRNCAAKIKERNVEISGASVWALVVVVAINTLFIAGLAIAFWMINKKLDDAIAKLEP